MKIKFNNKIFAISYLLPRITQECEKKNPTEGN